MKKYKKILLLLIIFLISTISNVYANEKAEVTLVSDKKSVEKGERIIVSVAANNENGIEGIEAVLNYDKTKLELEKLEMKNDFLDQSGIDSVSGEYIFTALFGGNEAPTEVEVSELTFKVLEGVTDGEELKIELLHAYIIDTDIEKENVEDKEIIVKVVGQQNLEQEQQPELDSELEPDPEQQPETDPEPEPEQQPDPENKPEQIPEKLPQTGKTTKSLIFVVVFIVSIMLYIKIRKYKSI